ncbi:MAG TPA: hypothetical protein VHR15_19975 [Ktedonobacterales bacterium]|jgi:hypothetical protein|nr:hypothetical protein [Ktedonobacterales bacterium]
MPAENKRPVEAHASTPALGPLVYGLFPAEFTYRISNGVITAYGATADKELPGSFEEQLEQAGFPHVATAWGVSGTELTARVYERHPAESASHATPVAERILIVVNLNCVERYYLAPDLHDALPFLAQVAATSAALAQSMNALHQREERLRREALTGGLAGPLEQIAKALRAYAATEMLDDALAREEEPHNHDAPALAEDTLTSDLHIGDNGPDAETADTLLTDLLRRRSRQRKNNTND